MIIQMSFTSKIKDGACRFMTIAPWGNESNGKYGRSEGYNANLDKIC